MLPKSSNLFYKYFNYCLQNQTTREPKSNRATRCYPLLATILLRLNDKQIHANHYNNGNNDHNTIKR